MLIYGMGPAGDTAQIVTISAVCGSDRERASGIEDHITAAVSACEGYGAGGRYAANADAHGSRWGNTCSVHRDVNRDRSIDQRSIGCGRMVDYCHTGPLVHGMARRARASYITAGARISCREDLGTSCREDNRTTATSYANSNGCKRHDGAVDICAGDYHITSGCGSACTAYRDCHQYRVTWFGWIRIVTNDGGCGGIANIKASGGRAREIVCIAAVRGCEGLGAYGVEDHTTTAASTRECDGTIDIRTCDADDTCWRYTRSNHVKVHRNGLSGYGRLGCKGCDARCGGALVYVVAQRTRTGCICTITAVRGC